MGAGLMTAAGLGGGGRKVGGGRGTCEKIQIVLVVVAGVAKLVVDGRDKPGAAW